MPAGGLHRESGGRGRDSDLGPQLRCTVPSPFAGGAVWHVCTLQQEQAPVGRPALQPQQHLLQGHPPTLRAALPPSWPGLTLSPRLLQDKQRELGDKMDLASYLLKPVQRMGKYALLLQDLVREASSCPAWEQELGELRAAQDVVRFQLRHGNDLLAMDAVRGCDVSAPRP